MGLMGACRANELYSMDIKDIQDHASVLVVNVPNTKTKIHRKFTIIGHLYEICRKYIDRRPINATSTAFFLNYQNGKCTLQRIGINKLGAMGKQIATFLNLPKPEQYTGHSFRRSSATILIDAGADITALKRHGGWKSTTVAEGYIDNSMNNKMNTANRIINSLTKSSTSTDLQHIHMNENINVKINSNKNNIDITPIPPNMHFNNCNVTVNIYNNKS